MQLGVKNGYQNGTQNESIVRQSTTFGTSPRATLGGPRGEMPVRSVHPIPGGGATVAPGKRPRGARKGPLRKEGTLVEDGLLTHMGAVQPLGSMWVESGAWRRRREYAPWTESGRQWKGDGGEEATKKMKIHTISRRKSIKTRQK